MMNFKKKLFSKVFDGGVHVFYVVEPVSGLMIKGAHVYVRMITKVRALQFFDNFEKLLNNGNENKGKLGSFFKELERNVAYQELLVDNVRAAIVSPSSKVISALAVIFHDHYKNKKAPDFFTKTAMNALSKMVDEECAVFIELTNLDKIKSIEGTIIFEPTETTPYLVVSFTKPLADHICSVTKLNKENIIIIINRLINFGILSESYDIRYDGGGCKYGINEYSQKIRDAFSRAKKEGLF